MVAIYSGRRGFRGLGLFGNGLYRRWRRDNFRVQKSLNKRRGGANHLLLAALTRAAWFSPLRNRGSEPIVRGFEAAIADPKALAGAFACNDAESIRRAELGKGLLDITSGWSKEAR